MTVDYNSKAYLKKVDAWWRTANYISVAQIYLKGNPLLRREIQAKMSRYAQLVIGERLLAKISFMLI